MYDDVYADIRNEIEAVEEAAEELRQAHRTFLADNSTFSVDDAIPHSDFTLGQVLGLTSALVSIVRGLGQRDGGAFVPRTFLDALRDKLKELRTQIDRATAQFATVKAQGFGSLDIATYIVNTRTGGQVVLGKPIRFIGPALDAAYASWYQLRLVARTPQLKELSNLLALAEARDSDLQIISNQMQERAKKVQGQIDEISDWHIEADRSKLEIVRVLKAIEIERKNVDEHAAEVTAKLAEVRSANEKAAALDTSISEYKSRFDSFDEQIDAQVARMDAEKVLLADIHSRLDEKERDIHRLLEESEGLLRGATNVGLGASFSKLQTEISSELWWARYSFYGSIGFLIVLSLPLAFYVFPGLNVVFKEIVGTGIDAIPKSLEGKTTIEALAQIAARALLLIPGIWLVRFAGARHERLFRLREHYAYKYSVASSVEGFKKQAPELEQAIAVTAFFELTFNPATRMDANSDEARHPNPVMEWLMKKLQADKAMIDAKKGGDN